MWHGLRGDHGIRGNGRASAPHIRRRLRRRRSLRMARPGSRLHDDASEHLRNRDPSIRPRAVHRHVGEEGLAILRRNHPGLRHIGHRPAPGDLPQRLAGATVVDVGNTCLSATAAEFFVSMMFCLIMTNADQASRRTRAMRATLPDFSPPARMAASKSAASCAHACSHPPRRRCAQDTIGTRGDVDGENCAPRPTRWTDAHHRCLPRNASPGQRAGVFDGRWISLNQTGITFAMSDAPQAHPFARIADWGEGHGVARAARTGVARLFIEPSSPWKNGCNGSFRSKLRDERLDRAIFPSLQ